MYWLNYLDRNAIALARINDLEEDLGLSSAQYQTCVSILFVGYLLGQIPSNMFLTRTRPSMSICSSCYLLQLMNNPGRYMGVAMMLWAVVSALTAVSKNFTGLLLTRFFLGLTEAPYYPGAVYLLSIFYTRKEVATRIAILYTGNILATAFAGLIAAGIFHGLDDVAGLSGWRWLFILQGAVTFVIAVVGFFMLPDFPHDTKWLTPDERALATNRMELDTVGNQGETSTRKGFMQAAKDPMVWIFALMAHMQYVVHFAIFSPMLIMYQSRRQRFQELLSHSCPDARFQRDYYSGTHLPALSYRWRYHDRRVLEQRQVQRADVAHHHLKDCSYHWFRGSLCNHGFGRPLRLHGGLHHRNIWCKLAYSGMVW